MAFFQFRREQFIKAPPAQVWEFISSPKNLKKITPDYMGFEITNPDLPDKMYPGMIISYLVRPLLGIKTTWVTEITHVEKNIFFVDEQRVGPYKMWHHEHHIEAYDDGTLMRDIISYEPPFGFLGNLMNKLVIEKKLNEIFDFRKLAIEFEFSSK